jgi:hypothetical protein
MAKREPRSPNINREKRRSGCRLVADGSENNWATFGLGILTNERFAWRGVAASIPWQALAAARVRSFRL